MYNDVFSVGVHPTTWHVAMAKKAKNGQELSCIKLAICPDHPRRHSPLKFWMRGHVREIVVYFKFHENRLRGQGAVEVRNRPLPLTWPMAYTTACTTVLVVTWIALVSQPSYCTILQTFGYHSVNSSSHGVSGDIAIQWDWSNFDPS